MREKLFRYVGAKGRLIKTLLYNFPKGYTSMKFVDLFGGSGIVLYRKQPSEIEIFNDLDEGVSSIFWCLMNDYERFCFRLQYATHSENIFKWFINGYKPANRLELAVKTMYEIMMSFGGKRMELSRVPKTSRKKQTKQLYRIFLPTLFEKWRHRFVDHAVQIYNEDFEVCINRTDESNAFYYCDPPYVLADRHYQIVFTEADHIRLFNQLNKLEGKFLLSYDDDPFIRNLYQDYHIKTIELKYMFVAESRDTLRNELLIANYPLPEQTKLEEHL